MSMENKVSIQNLEEILGPVGFMEYDAAPKWDQEKIQHWAASLQVMSDDDFTAEASVIILESALMERFRGNYEGIHARCSACHHEAKRRHVASGHEEDCRGSNLYAAAWNRAAKSQGYSINQMNPCSCGKE